MPPMEFIDCKTLRCPMPIVQIGRFIKQAAPGARVRVEACDPAFRADLEAWARRGGHTIVEFEPGTIQTAVIEKGPG